MLITHVFNHYIYDQRIINNLDFCFSFFFRFPFKNDHYLHVFPQNNVQVEKEYPCETAYT